MTANFTDKYIQKLEAWEKGKNPWLTLETDNKAKPFQRVRANTILGDPRVGWFYSGKKDKDKKDE